MWGHKNWIKFIHELFHAGACKKFIGDEGEHSEIHEMGLIFVAFIPFPYHDASASCILKNKWRRMAVAAAGIYAELLIAALAIITWSFSSDGTLLNNMCYAAAASVFISLFINLNPFLKYDGYYILSDFSL